MTTYHHKIQPEAQLPWINKGIKHKNHLYFKAGSTRSVDDWRKYREAKAIMQTSLWKTECNFVDNIQMIACIAKTRKRSGGT